MTNVKHDLNEGAALNLNASATGVQRRTLDAIFGHPLSHNLPWREVVNLFTAIGDAEEGQNGDFIFRAGSDTLGIKKPHHKELTGSDVMDLRHFLTRAGWSPGASAASQTEASEAEPGLIVVIDHAGAKVYGIDRFKGGGQGAPVDELAHLRHHIERKARDGDRDEIYPEDERFFEQVADAISTGGEIIVIGHGKGQSNEADHLSAFLKARHNQTFAKIVREVVADLPHLTGPELIALGRQAFAQA